MRYEKYLLTAVLLILLATPFLGTVAGSYRIIEDQNHHTWDSLLTGNPKGNGVRELFFSLELTQPNIEVDPIEGTLSLGGEGWFERADPGDFNLPVKPVNVLIPFGSEIDDIEIQWGSSEMISSGLEVDKVPMFDIKSTILPEHKGELDEIQEQSLSSIRDIEPGIEDSGVKFFRGFSYNVLSVSPFQYELSGDSLYFYSSAEVTLKLGDEPLNDRSELLRIGSPDGYLFDIDELLEREFVPTYPLVSEILGEYEDLALISDRSIPQPGEEFSMVVITSSGFYDDFIPFAEWKINKGIATKIVNVSDITSDADYNGVDTQEEIHNFIKDAYNNWNTEYVILGGDVSIVPHRGFYVSMTTGSGPVADHIPADLYYACLDDPFNNDGDSRWGEENDGAGGNDIDVVAEVYVGRVSADTAGQVAAFIGKTLDYERDPRPNYVQEVLLNAAWLDQFTDGALSSDAIFQDAFPDGFTATRLYSTLNNASKTNFNNKMNSGMGMVYNVGHANHQGISIDNHTSHSRTDADGLSSDHKFSVFYTMGCLANRFDVSDTYAEHMMYNPDGGSVVFIGNTRYGLYSPGNMLSSPSHVFAINFFDQLFQEGHRDAGRANQLGKEELTWLVGNEYYRWIYFTINYMGDPSMQIWFNEPQEIDVEHPPAIYAGSPAPVEVNVNTLTRAPVEGANVAIVNWPDAFSNATTDATGVAELFPNPNDVGTANITVTGPDIKPYYSTMLITDDMVEPIITVNVSSYGPYYDDPGAVMEVDFSNGGSGSDLWFAQYKDGLTGRWQDIFNGTAGSSYIVDWALDWTEIQDGVRTIFIRCVDEAWNIALDSVTFEKDYQPPFIQLDKDEMGWFGQDPQEAIGVHVESTRAGTQLNRAFYTINQGDEVEIFNEDTVAYDGSVLVNWTDLKDGINYLNFTALDQLDVRDNSSAQVIYKKDSLVPEIIINNVTYGYYTSDPGSVIDVDFFDQDLSLLHNATFRIENGSWQEIFSGGRINHTLDWGANFTEFDEGPNYMDICAWDGAGNQLILEDAVVFCKDTRKPDFLSDSYLFGWFSQDPGPVIDIDFSSGGGSPLVMGEYRLGGGDWETLFNDTRDNYTQDWAVDFSSLHEGLNSLDVRVVDSVNNIEVSQDLYEIGIDFNPPEIWMDKQVYNYTETEEIIFGGQYFQTVFSTGGSGSDLTYAQYRVGDMGEWINISDSLDDNETHAWRLNRSLLSQGLNVVHLRVFDHLFQDDDNISILIFYDSRPPIIEVSSNELGWYNQDPGIMLHLDVRENGTGSNLTSIEYNVDDDDEWYIVFQDVFNGTTVGTEDRYSEEIQFDFNVINEGYNKVTIRAWDHSGKSAETEVTVKKDTVSPVSVLLASPGNSQDTSFTTIYLAWGEVDRDLDGSRIIGYEYEVSYTDGFADPFASGSVEELTSEVTIIKSGKYYWRVRAFDEAGNIGEWSSIWSFYRNSPPRARMNISSRGDIYHPFLFDASASEDEDGSIVNYTWTLDDKVQIFGETIEYLFTVNGTYDIRLTVRDDLGKVDIIEERVDIGGSKFKPGDHVNVGGQEREIIEVVWDEEQDEWTYVLDDGSEIPQDDLAPFRKESTTDPLEKDVWGVPWQYLAFAVGGVLIIFLVLGIIILKKRSYAPIVCPKCGKRVRSQAENCPSCGEVLYKMPYITSNCKKCSFLVYDWEDKCPKCDLPISKGKEDEEEKGYGSKDKVSFMGGDSYKEKYDSFSERESTPKSEDEIASFEVRKSDDKRDDMDQFDDLEVDPESESEEPELKDISGFDEDDQWDNDWDDEWGDDEEKADDQWADNDDDDWIV